MSIYVVHNENTPSGFVSMGVLASKVIHPNGSGFNPMNGSAPVHTDELRLATKEDFDFFRVCSKGYFND